MERVRIFLKMMWFNRGNYLLFLLCSSFTTAFLQAFLSIGQNRSFMFSSRIDPMISSNVYAPTVLTVLFMVLFIPYAYEAFFRSRKQEYAVLMTLGMTEYEVIGAMTAEWLVIGALGFAAGSILGTVLSAFFFFFLCHVIGLPSMRWEFHIETYAVSAKVYAAVAVLILLLNIIKFVCTRLRELFQARYREERRRKGTMVRFLTGTAVLLSAGAVMLGCYSPRNTDIWFGSAGTAAAGLCIVFRNFDCLFHKSADNRWKISLSLVLQYIKSWRLVSFLSAFLFIVVIFFSAHSAVTFPGMEANALAYSPYDLFYVRSAHINDMGEDETEHILKKHGVTAAEEKTMEFLRNGSFNILSADEVRDKLGYGFQVSPGRFIQLFQYDKNDGYEHNLQPAEEISVRCGGNGLHLVSEGQENRILLNSCRSLADRTLIVNAQDYVKIRDTSDEYICETAVMYQFDNWRKSGDAVEELQESMNERNGLSEEDQYGYALSSKIESYENAERSSEVLAFLLFFVDGMFFAAANISIFYKIKSELKEERRIARNLYRVGITEREFRDILRRKNRCYYWIPVLSAVLIGVFYGCSVNSVYGCGKTGFVWSVLASCAVMAMQALIVGKVTEYEAGAAGFRTGRR